MKNVAGIDVARGLTGSWGTLAVMTEVTFKVAPLPQTMVTLAYTGLPDDLGIEALTVAMGTPLEVFGRGASAEKLRFPPETHKTQGHR